MLPLTGHLRRDRERATCARAAPVGTQVGKVGSFYRVPARGSTRGRSVTEKRAPDPSASARALGLPKQRVIGLYAAGSSLRAAPPPTGYSLRGWLEGAKTRPFSPSISLPPHSGAKERREARARRDAAVRGRARVGGAAAAIFVGGFTAE